MMEIISARSKRDITVKFLDYKGYVTKALYQNFKRGTIRNPYDKTIFGIGYIGKGKFKIYENGIKTREYIAWSGMMERCYNEKTRYNYPTYEGCTVCEEWLNFQNFAKWYDKHLYHTKDGKRMHLDKDILVHGNKIYSPETCMIIPQRINMLYMDKHNKTGLPHGITKRKRGYNARYNCEQLGIFPTLEEAKAAYDAKRNMAIRLVVDEYKDELPDEVYMALVA